MSYNISQWKLALSVHEYNDDMLSRVRDAGVDMLELSFNENGYENVLKMYNDPMWIAEKASEYDVRLWSLHLPFSGARDITANNDADREKTIELNKCLIAASAKIGCKVVVIHPSAEPITPDNRPLRLSRSIENLHLLSEYAAEKGIRLAVENLPRTCLGHHSDEILTMLEQCPALGVCFDTNHMLIQDNVGFIKAVGENIITLHVSDYDFIDERHWLPLEGKNDWKAIITALSDVGYDGPWLYESKGTPADVADNKRKLEQL